MLRPLLQVQDLTLKFRSSNAGVNGIDLLIGSGETLGLLGESGAGKTTLARAILGLNPPACQIVSGSVWFREINVLQSCERELQNIRGAQISYISQEPEIALNPLLSIKDQVAEVLRAHSSDNRRLRYEKTYSMLAAVGLPDNQIHSAYPHQLSGGQRQRVAIAQALVCEPALLVADELTSALDEMAQVEILSLLKQLKKHLKLATLLITHNPALLQGFADRVAVMYAGRIVEENTFEQICKSPCHPFTKKLIEAIPVTSSKILRSIEPQTVPLLEVRNLHRSYVQGGWRSSTRRRITALNGIDLMIFPKDTLALVGRSGSGKSTLGRCLACLEKADAGKILLHGRDVVRLSNHDLLLARRQVQLIFQHSATAINPLLSAVEVVEEPLRFFTSLSKQERHNRALDIMEQVGISSQSASRRSLEFSGGQRQRLAIARALILKPDLLILDEALAGLDLSTQNQIVDILIALQVSFSVAYLFISHDLPMVARIANAVAFIKDGRITEPKSVAALFSNPQDNASQMIRLTPQVRTPPHFPDHNR